MAGNVIVQSGMLPAVTQGPLHGSATLTMGGGEDMPVQGLQGHFLLLPPLASEDGLFLI